MSLARRCAREGLTVIEALMAAMLSAAVLGLAAALLASALAGVRGGERRLGSREELHIAYAQVRAALMDARTYRITDGGRRLEFLSSQGAGELAFDAERDRLQLSLEGRASSVIVRAGVHRFAALSLRPGLVRLMAEVSTAARPGEPDCFVLFEEIFIAAVGEQPWGDTWNPVSEEQALPPLAAPESVEP